MGRPGTAKAVAGLLLAGGEGRRVGGADKGLLLWQGRPLVDSVLARMAPQVPLLAISANRHLDAYAKRGWPLLTDAAAHQGLGPLAGVHAGLQWAQAQGMRWLWTCPCDAPLLPLDLAERLLAVALQTGASAAAPVLAGRWQAVHTLWSVDLLQPVAQALAQRQLKLQALLDSLSASPLVLDAEAAAFANFNHLDCGLC